MWFNILMGVIVLFSVVVMMACLHAASIADKEMERNLLSIIEKNNLEDDN